MHGLRGRVVDGELGGSGVRDIQRSTCMTSLGQRNVGRVLKSENERLVVICIFPTSGLRVSCIAPSNIPSDMVQRESPFIWNTF